jgi:hypothetical protein
MDNQAKITVPYLTGGVYSEDQAAFEHFVTAIEQALGVHFEDDKEGRFEELEPLVSFPLGYTIAIRMDDGEDYEEDEEDFYLSRSAAFTLDVETFISMYSLNIAPELVDDTAFWLSEFLSRYLTQKTGYFFHAESISDELAPQYSFAVPLFTAQITGATEQPLTTAFHNIGESLSIPMERIQVGTISRTGGQQFTAQLFGHTVTVSGQPSSNETNTITLLLQPSPDTHTFIHESGTLESAQLSIDAFLARLVSRDTGIEFTPAPRPEDVS